MDLFSKIIKRPLSLAAITTNDDGNSSSTAAGTDVSAATAANLVTTGHPLHLGDRSPLLSLRDLLDSAAQDINQLEDQHNNLIAMPQQSAASSPSPPSTSSDSIQKLLSAIHVNLNQVSAHEMEHLQAMSAELSPLAAIKASPKPTMEQPQQKIAALDPLKLGDPSSMIVVPPSPRGVAGGGLPEFDESQIPELPPFSADMMMAVSGASAVTSLNSTAHDYNSDSDVFVECLSLTSDKRYSNDPAELEAYTSAINEVLLDEQQNAMQQIDTPSGGNANPADCSYEPMDVDELNATMEILKDVMAPEDHQLLKEQFMSDVIEKAQLLLSNDPLGETDQTPEDPLKLLNEDHYNDELEASPLTSSDLLDNDKTQTQEVETNETFGGQEELTAHELESSALKEKHQADESQLAAHELESSALKEMHQADEQQLNITSDPLGEVPQAPEKQTSQKEEDNIDDIKTKVLDLPENDVDTQNIEIEKIYVQPVENIPLSPPIPTHRAKTAEELNFLALKELPEDEGSQEKIQKADNEPKVIPIAFVTPTCMTTMPIGPQTTNNPTFPTSPRSPTFPVQDPAEPPSHFPHSPHAPAETEEMPYLEQAVVQPSSDRPLSGVIAKMPVSINIIQSSPEEKENKLDINETLPMDEVTSPLPVFNGNSTFSSGNENEVSASPTVKTAVAAAPLQPTATFSVSLDDVKNESRRTFTANTSPSMDTAVAAAPLQPTDTFSVSLNDDKSESRRTYNVNNFQEEKQQQLPRRTFFVEDNRQIEENPPVLEQPSVSEKNTRKTFNLESKALEQKSPISTPHEATEEDDFEPMDVDVSMRSAETPALTRTPSVPICNVQSAPESPPFVSTSPPIPTHQTQQLKRVPIHGNTTIVLDEQQLSAKEQATLSASDEKDDVFVEHFGAISPLSDDMFKTPQYTSNNFAKIQFKEPAPTRTTNRDSRGNIAYAERAVTGERPISDAEFQDGASCNNLIFNSSDFDYLYTKGNNNAPVDRSSLLLKFDPLLGTPVPVNSLQQQELALSNLLGGNNNNNNNNNRALSPTLEEHESSGSNQSFAIETSAKSIVKELEFKPPVDRTKKHAKMSVDVIDNDCNKTFDNSNLNTEDKANNYHNMEELDKKLKNDVTRSEDIEKKLKDAEQREEALIKRITEKDKMNSKLNGVIEAYEKAIAELISEKEQLVQDYDRQLQEVQTDRDANYHHLTSLETTFSDLHVKYEKSKEMTLHLRQVEETLLAEKKQTAENLQLQEQRYEKMKSHAMQQLEIANKKLDSCNRERADEVKKLKALLKKEEVSRVSTAEQLQQKSRENADLLKICEELIYGKGQGGSS
ncbi:transforming acidic coiled-coil-containing protein 3 isoform X2 [Drosophila willistoni]|uniref:transforming acidic coiled-coil-containing protein 3 isoform X2 n=1 Tax=Drosophila willistoni TaxID=7260 RepID=UPI001F0725EA|nr:transforming acidic coiled-coil-containing protein 3 isoform X2 [Drosophila willistoni]